MSENKKQRLESVAHYLTAFVIFLKGFDKIGTPGKTGFALLFILLAALILLGTIFHHTIEKKFKHFKPVVFVFEGIVIAIVGYLYQKDGKQYLPFVCYAAALVFLIATIMHFIKRTSAGEVNPVTFTAYSLHCMEYLNYQSNSSGNSCRETPAHHWLDTKV